MDKDTLWQDIQKYSSELKDNVDSFNSSKDLTVVDLGNISFQLVLLQEKIENMIRMVR